MERLNYGLALSGSGDFQIIDTTAGRGIKDDYSESRSESFTFFVAPHDWIDNELGIANLSGDAYLKARVQKNFKRGTVKALVLRYHGITTEVRKPTWS